MTRGLEARLAKAEAALAQGPDGIRCYCTDDLAAVLRGLGRPADEGAVRRAQGELRHDPALQRAWREAGHELAEIMIFLLPGDWDL